ncbi:MAG: hypothetical protein RR704_14880 [Stenotrophomonas sp.]
MTDPLDVHVHSRRCAGQVCTGSVVGILAVVTFMTLPEVLPTV